MTDNINTKLNIACGMVLLMSREMRNLTQEELAKKAKLSRTTITNIENGNQSIPLDVLFFLAKALDIPAYKLIRLIEILVRIGNKYN